MKPTSFFTERPHPFDRKPIFIKIMQGDYATIIKASDIVAVVYKEVADLRQFEVSVYTVNDPKPFLFAGDAALDFKHKFHNLVAEII